MEIKLLQEFDYNDKGSLFGQMDNMNDAIVKDIREGENSLFIILHKFDDIQDPNGEVIWPYKELEIEYEYAKKDFLSIDVYGNRHRRVTPSGLLDWVKKEKAELEMNNWMITSGGFLLLKLLPHPKDIRRKSRITITDVEVWLLPQKIIYRWMS